MKTVCLLEHKENNPRNSEGAFIRLADGRILCAYTRYFGKEGHDHSTANIAGVISSDDGKTWTDAGILIPKDEGAMNLMSVSLLRLQDGRIAMVYVRKSQTPDGGYADCRPWIIFSSDEAKTWSEPVSVAGQIPSVYIVVNNDRLIQLKSGRLVIPAAWYRWQKQGINDQGIAVFFLSDDGGATWRESRQCCYPPNRLGAGLAEPGVIELADGILMAWARTNGGCQYKMFSFDQGESWTEAQGAREFLSPESPLSMKRNPKDGFLYAVWNCWDPKFSVRMKAASWGRTPLVIARSTDEGKSWTDFTVLENEPDHGYCYIAMLFRNDELLLEYCCGGGKNSFVLQDAKIAVVDLAKLNSGYPED